MVDGKCRGRHLLEPINNLPLQIWLEWNTNVDLTLLNICLNAYILVTQVLFYFYFSGSYLIMKRCMQHED